MPGHMKQTKPSIVTCRIHLEYHLLPGAKFTTNLSGWMIIQPLETSWTLIQLRLAFVGITDIAFLLVSHVG